MFSLSEYLNQYRGKNFELHEKYMNPQMPAVLKTLGFDKFYERGEGAYLIDREGRRYLDLLCGYGVFNIGRDHPFVRKAILEALESSLPNMVHFDCPLLSGLLAKKLVEKMPENLNRVFFCNSGAEAIEGAIKFARRYTWRNRLLRCKNAFHGLTTGALSLNGNPDFQKGFGSLLPCDEIPLNDVKALEEKLKTKQYAAFFVEPVQGKGVYIASQEFLQKAEELCRTYGTVLVVDEVQTGFGRTGKWFSFEHYGIRPQIVCLAKSLSGGFIPVGAIVMEEEIMKATFSSMDECMVHSSTFAQNDLAMVAGLATIAVLEEEKLVERAEKLGEYFLKKLKPLEEFEMVKEVRGLGLMVGIEFGPPSSLSLKALWKMLHTTEGLFGQMIVIPLMRDFGILTQVAGKNDVIKLLPPLTIEEKDLDYVAEAFQKVVKNAHSLSSVWHFGKTLAELGRNAMKARAKK